MRFNELSYYFITKMYICQSENQIKNQINNYHMKEHNNENSSNWQGTPERHQ